MSATGPRRIDRRDALIYAALLTWTAVVLVPLAWLVVTTLQAPGAGAVFSGRGAITWRFFMNSVIVAGGSAALTLVPGAAAGYGLSRFHYYWPALRWRNAQIARWLLAQRVVPPAALAVPFVLLYREAGLRDTHIGLVLVHAAFNLPFAVWLLRDAFDHLPLELEDSARVDGASHFEAFSKIVLPPARPGLAAAFLLAFVLSWNEFLFAFTLQLTDITLPVFVAGQNGMHAGQRGYLAALALLATVPVVLIGFAFERYFDDGMIAHTVKRQNDCRLC